MSKLTTKQKWQVWVDELQLCCEYDGHRIPSDHAMLCRDEAMRDMNEADVLLKEIKGVR